MSLEIIQRIQMLEDRYNALYNNSKKIQELENATSIGADTQLLVNKVGLNNSYELQRADYSLVAPDASATERGFINTIAQTFAGTKSFNNLIWAKATPTDVINTNLGSIGIGTDGSNPLFSFRIDTLGNLNLDKVYNGIFSNVLSVNRATGKLEVKEDALINNVSVGRGTGNVASNTVLGYQALYSGNTGGSNVAIGFNALKVNTSGYNNTSVGYASLYQNTIGGFNTAIGLQSLYQNTLGNDNTAIGLQALFSNISGSYNTAIGRAAGSVASDGVTANSTGNNSVFIGFVAKANANGQTNQIVIGASAIGNGSNTATIGNTSVTALYVGGNGAGIVLKTPDGLNSYKISIANDGTIISTLI